MIIVDTSVIIDFLKGANNSQVELFDTILDKKIPYGINDFIFQEVLQGSRDINEYHQLKEYLDSIPFFYLRQGKLSYECAAFMNYSCRRKGVTIRSTIDLIIAQTAIENSLFVLHKDGDFENIAKVIPDLKIYKGIFT
ncbi:MAG: PIN domain nuclease [Treponemataceae bacterium]